MKKILKILLLHPLIICFLLLSSCEGLGLYITDYLDNNSFDSIEELYTTMTDAIYEKAPDNGDCDFFPLELLEYFEYEDLAIMYIRFQGTRNEDDEEEKWRTCLRFATKQNNKYKLLIGKADINHLRIEELIDYLDRWIDIDYYVPSVRINGRDRSMCFLYKELNDTRSFYYDGNKCEERIMTDHRTGEQFYLCYALSFPESAFYTLTHSPATRHTLEAREE